MTREERKQLREAEGRVRKYCVARDIRALPENEHNGDAWCAVHDAEEDVSGSAYIDSPLLLAEIKRLREQCSRLRVALSPDPQWKES